MAAKAVADRARSEVTKRTIVEKNYVRGYRESTECTITMGGGEEEHHRRTNELWNQKGIAITTGSKCGSFTAWGDGGKEGWGGGGRMI